MEKQNIWKKIVSKVVVAAAMIWIYLPIIAGIITPMVWLLPTLYYSWYLFGSGFGVSTGFNGFIPVTSLAIEIILLVFETIVFFLGCYLLIAGIIHLAKARKEKLNVVSAGPYKFIRHPQHLGLILISLPFALIISPNDLGIRIGDILSLLLNLTILMILSSIEEVKMKQRFPEEYSRYKQQTGFFFPKIRKKELDFKKQYHVKTRKELILNYSLIIGLYLLGFAIIVVMMYLLVNYTGWRNYLLYVR